MYAVLGGRGRDDPASSIKPTDITMLRAALTLAILAVIAIVLLQNWIQRAKTKKGKIPWPML